MIYQAISSFSFCSKFLINLYSIFISCVTGFVLLSFSKTVIPSTKPHTVSRSSSVIFSNSLIILSQSSMLCHHLYCPGLERFVIPRRCCSSFFFRFHFLLPLSFPVYYLFSCPSIRVWGHICYFGYAEDAEQKRFVNG